MTASLKRLYLHVLLSGGQLVLLLVGFHTDSRAGWLTSFSLIAAISFIAWMSVYRRARAIDDTPTSNVASAAQGYVELLGEAQNTPGARMTSPQSNVACVWYRYTVHERRNNKWHYLDGGESDASFVLADATGRCLVDPEGAEIIGANEQTWTREGHRITEWTIRERDPLYVLGEFRTISHAPSAADFSGDVAALLVQWKRNQPELLRRFDGNRDGKIDLAEWEQARRAARAEVEKSHREIRDAPHLDCMRAPADGRLYLISNLQPAALARKYRLWAWVHVAIFLAAVGGFAGNLA